MFWVFSNIVTTLRSMFRQKNASLIVGKHCIKKWTLPTPAVDEDNIHRNENKDTCGGFPCSRGTSDEPVLRCSGGHLEQVEPVRRKKWRRPGCVGRRVTLEIPASGWLRCPSMPFQRLAQFAEEDSQTNSFPTEMKAASQVQLFVCLSTTSTLCAWLWLWLWLFHSTPSMCFILNFGNEKFCAGGWQSTTERRLETKGIIWSLPIQLLEYPIPPLSSSSQKFVCNGSREPSEIS